VAVRIGLGLGFELGPADQLASSSPVAASLAPSCPCRARRAGLVDARHCQSGPGSPSSSGRLAPLRTCLPLLDDAAFAASDASLQGASFGRRLSDTAHSERIGPDRSGVWSLLTLALPSLSPQPPPPMTRVMDHQMVVVRMRLTFKAFAAQSPSVRQSKSDSKMG